jgi:hypothetical protein
MQYKDMGVWVYVSRRSDPNSESGCLISQGWVGWGGELPVVGRVLARRRAKRPRKQASGGEQGGFAFPPARRSGPRREEAAEG